MTQNSIGGETHRIPFIINRSALAGTVLGAVSAVCMFINMPLSSLSETSPFIGNLISFILWAAKFAGCIWIMRFFMNKFAKENSDATNRDTFLYGLFASLLSALLFAALTMVNMTLIAPDFYSAQYDLALQTVAPMLDSNTMSKMSSIMERMPEISFFQTLIYCFLYGTILSSILSRGIPKKDPFAEYRNPENSAE